MKNREIKFRAKRIDTNEWTYGWYFPEVEGSDDSLAWDYVHFIKTIYGDHYQDHKIDIKTLGQSTGLKDVNGKEIYEGDILKFHDHKDYFSSIDWDDDEAGFSTNHFTTDECDQAEVIGNIFENTDLLTQTK